MQRSKHIVDIAPNNPFIKLLISGLFLNAYYGLYCYNDDQMAWFSASVRGCSLKAIEAMMPRIKTALSQLK